MFARFSQGRSPCSQAQWLCLVAKPSCAIGAIQKENHHYMFNRSRFRFIRYVLLSLMALVLTMVVAACDSGPTTTDTASPGASPAAETTLKVALDPTFPPFQTQTGEGQFEGFDIDIMNAIADAGGFTMELQGLPFDGIIPALQSGTMDATMSTMTITAERAQVVDFSRPYFQSGLAIAVREDNTDITSLESLAGKSVAVQIGTTGEIEARSANPAEVRTFDSTPLALQELANGNVDAALSDAPVILYAIQTGSVPGLKVAAELLADEFYGIATPKGSPNLELINSGLSTILENGTYTEIYQKWFGEEPPTLPEAAPI
ncbi:basic amino acid ABC transporter substrate-binding protein [Leptolyngbya sp. AN02str]|uniref:basic amino acid ABC transporter substrate-binding protein n=1 Tax=Leptolyngbya sp. AN02str TaxID=3423363 RepID=UPI003D31437C